MTDISPESAAPQGADSTVPGPLSAPRAPRRASLVMRNPLVRIASAVIGVALGWGAVQAGQHLWAGRNDNTPISSSSHAPSGALRVTGHGVTLTFPHDWVNVPTTPAHLAQFMRANAAKFHHLRAAIKSELENVQNMRDTAALVYRFNSGGTFTGSLFETVVPAAVSLNQMLHHLNAIAAQLTQIGGTIQHKSVTSFGSYQALLVTYTLPGQAKGQLQYCAVAFVEGPASTPIITVKTLSAADSIATLRKIADTIRFS